MNYSIGLIKPNGFNNREKEYGFQINSKKPCWSFFVILNLTKTWSKYKIPFFRFKICEHYGPILKLGRLRFQYTVWDAA